MGHDSLFERGPSMIAGPTKRQSEPTTSPDRSRSTPSYPLGAAILSAAGALLIVLEGIYLLSSRGIPSTNGFYPSDFLIPSVQVAANIALLEGAVALGLALMVYERPRSDTFVGVALLTIALLSLFIGGGFLLGAMLVYVGGIMAIYHHSERAPSAGAGLPIEDSNVDSTMGGRIPAVETTPSDVLTRAK